MHPDSVYSLWNEMHHSTLKNFRGKRIVLLFSGGKDSSVTMDFIQQSAKEFGFDFEAHAGTFPVHRYSDAEKHRIDSYWQKRGIKIRWHDIKKTDDLLNNSKDPCHVCQKVRKSLLQRILTQTVADWSDLILIISFSLQDLVSYAVEYLLSNMISAPRHGEDTEKILRFKETAQRFYPLLEMKEGYSVFRPLITLNDDDIKKIIARKHIPILSVPCRFSGYSPKRILENYYEKMGLRFDYDRLFDFALKALGFPDIASYKSMPKEDYLLRIF